MSTHGFAVRSTYIWRRSIHGSWNWTWTSGTSSKRWSLIRTAQSAGRTSTSPITFSVMLGHAGLVGTRAKGSSCCALSTAADSRLRGCPWGLRTLGTTLVFTNRGILSLGKERFNVRQQSCPFIGQTMVNVIMALSKAEKGFTLGVGAKCPSHSYRMVFK